MDSMEFSVPMLLPKGIVMNASSVYKEVASYPVVPADKIWEYWHVYTTTNKRLKDPTARRLENFWWQVWGSDRRNLSGAALARLYEDISVGPTFVPLRGPPNRWEGPEVPAFTKDIIRAHLGRGPSSQSPTQSLSEARSGDASVRNLSSSASKPPPPHPILKKARGPSSSGPRPTARFISPHESADEDDQDSDIPSPDSTVAMDLELPLPPKNGNKTPVIAQKLTATLAVANSRPGIPRRTSPQSPLATEFNPQKDTSSTTPRSSALKEVSPYIPETVGNPLRPTVEKDNDTEASALKQHKLSAKAAGKRPALQRRITPDKTVVLRHHSRSSTSTQQSPRPSALRPETTTTTPSHQRRASDVPLHVRATPRSSGVVLNGSSEAGSAAETGTPMGRSQSHNGYGMPDRGSVRLGKSLRHGLFTGATATTTNVAAQGTIIDQSGLGSLPPSTMLNQRWDESTLPSRTSTSSLLDSQFTPTQPTTSASVPMGRTKSQLTLLLEREKSKIREKPRSRSGA